MDNNKNRMKDREKSNSELRKIDPTGNADVGIENGEKIGCRHGYAFETGVSSRQQKLRDEPLFCFRTRESVPGGLLCLFFCLIADAQLCEEGFQQRTALLLQYPSGDGYLVVELGHLQEIQDGAAAACLGVHTAHDHLGDAGLDDGTGAHLAGLQRHIEGAFLQSPVSDLLAGFVDGGDLRVGQCIFVRIPAVIPPADDLTLVDNDAADGHFSQCIGFLRLPQGFPHVFFCNIRNHRHIYTLHFVDIFQRVVYHNHRQIRGICVCFKE